MASFPAACSLFHMLALAGKQMAVGSASSRHGGLLCFYHLSLLFFCVLIYTILIFHLQPLYVKFSLAALPQLQTFLTTVKRDQLCHDGLTMSLGYKLLWVDCLRSSQAWIWKLFWVKGRGDSLVSIQKETLVKMNFLKQIPLNMLYLVEIKHR